VAGLSIAANHFMPQQTRASADGFSHSKERLQELTSTALKYAAQRGASACEAEVSEAFGQSVTVRKAEVETIEYHRDKDLSVTVYLGQQRGHASTSDLSHKAIHDTVDAALAIARHTAADPFSGLPDAELLARDIPELDLFHPWALPVEQAIELARECEQHGVGADARVSNSDGASISTHQSQFVLANSLGFSGGFAASRHGVSCSMIAGSDDDMQRDDWYSAARAQSDLEAVAAVGRKAGLRAARRTQSRKIATVQVPVLFEAPIASSLLGHFVGAVSGGSLYRKASFLLDSVGRQIFPVTVQIHDLPHLPRGLASAPFDDEGVVTQARQIIKDGVLQGYFLGSYSARKLSLRTTGNAGGNHNLIAQSTGEDFAALLKMMDRGLLVTEMLGQGVNGVTGDYSRGAAGFWVENGEIAYPVHEVTIAGNLKDMFLGIVAVGSDRLVRGSRQCGSILIDRMTVAGD
jgi:PmbA protein